MSGHQPPAASTGNPLEFLRNQPQFQQMRQIIQQNPALLPALLQQLGRDNPQLLQVLSTAIRQHSYSRSCLPKTRDTADVSTNNDAVCVVASYWTFGQSVFFVERISYCLECTVWTN